MNESTIALPDMTHHETEGKLIVPKATALTIQTQNDYEKTLDFMRFCKGQIKDIETKMVKSIDLAFQLHRGLTKTRGELCQPWDSAYKIAERTAAGWVQEQRRIQAAIEEKVRKEAQERADFERKVKEKELEEERLKVAQEFHDLGNKQEAERILNEPIYVAPIAPSMAEVLPISSINEKVKGSSVRERWLHRVTDEKLIPREYLMLDERKLAKVVSALGKEAKIPGIEVYPELNISTRKISNS